MIAKGMAKDAAERYPSAGELITATESALQHLPPARLRQRPTFSAGGVRPRTPDSDSGAWPAAAGALSSETAAEAETDPHEPARGLTRRRKGRMVSLAAGVAILAGVIAGVLLSGGGRAAASSRVAHSGALSINYRRPWIGTHAAFGAFAVTPAGGSDTAAPIELASGGETLAAGALVDAAVIPGGPPPALVSRFGHPARTTRTRLTSGSSAVVYRWILNDGRDIETWVIPTARGDLAIICSAPAAGQSCAATAARAQVTGVPLLAVGPDLGLARSLRRIVADAAAGRTSLARADRAHPRRFAGTATAIASADRRAAEALGKLKVPARYQPTVSGLAVALGGEARALTALARVAQGRDRRTYAIAAAAVAEASRDLDASDQRARSDGILPFGLPPLKVPGLPAAATSPRGSPSTGGTPTTTAPSVTSPTHASTSPTQTSAPPTNSQPTTTPSQPPPKKHPQPPPPTYTYTTPPL